MPLRALIYDAAGNLMMTVRPDHAKQLDDPAFNPPGCKHLRVDLATSDIKTLEEEAVKTLDANDPVKRAVTDKYAVKDTDPGTKG